MKNVIPFPQRRENDKHAETMLRIADALDQTILNHLNVDAQAREIAGIMAHRLGTLVRQVSGKERRALIDVCEKVFREQARSTS